MGPSAEMFSAVGTVGAFTVSLYLLGQEMRNRARAQASQVAAWVEPRQAFERCGYDGVSLHLLNANNLPITACYLILRHRDGAAATIEHGSVAPNLHLRWQDDYMLPDMVDDWQIDDVAGVDIRFTDSFGRSWQRHPNGRLVRRRKVPTRVMVPATP